ncbi:MAG: hypothetical protein K1X95_13365 [Acidimicrobiia bacterium]|nr:hypothetical protein [Acidimicrobiia bacterium]
MPLLSRLRPLVLALSIILVVPLLPAGAGAAPATPNFGPSIDAYAAYDGQATCSPDPKPGTVDFSNMLLATYPQSGSYGISRDCNLGGQSEHKEGRAFDWMVSASDPSDVAAVDDVINWLLATDKYGNRHALARRLGIMYIIWNGYMWRAYRPDDGWQPYSGSNPHTDHVHFSFSWAGALRQTSWWTGGPRDYNAYVNFWFDKTGTNGNAANTVAVGGEVHAFGAPPSGTGVDHAVYTGDRFNWPSQTLDAGGPSTGRNIKSIWYAGELHVFNERAGGGIRHLLFSGGQWHAEDLDVGASSGQSIEVTNSLGELHIYNIVAGGGGIRHIVWSQGRWWFQDLDVGGSTGAGGISAIQAWSQLHLFTQRAGGNGLRHIVYDAPSGRYYFEDLDIGGTDGTFVDTVMYAGELHVVSRLTASGGIRHLNYSPAARRWYSQTMDTDGSVGMFLQVNDFAGDLHIFSTPKTGLGIRHDFWRGTEGRWEAATYDTYDPTGWWLSTVAVGGSLWVASSHTSGTGFWALRWQ